MSELLPCPFCGMDINDDEGCFPTCRDHSRFEARCGNPNCFAHEPSDESYEAAVARWNTRATAAPVVVGEDEPDKALLVSMAMRCNHGFGLDSARSQESQIADMRRCWEEVSGRGFYKPERRDFYLNTLTAAMAGD